MPSKTLYTSDIVYNEVLCVLSTNTSLCVYKCLYVYVYSPYIFTDSSIQIIVKPRGIMTISFFNYCQQIFFVLETSDNTFFSVPLFTGKYKCKIE